MVGSKMSVAVMVADASRSAKWYREKLGFAGESEDHWVTVWPKGATWKLHLCEEDASQMEPGNTGIALYAKDLKAEVARLKRKGVRFSMPITTRPWGTFAQVEDPDGNQIWLYPGAP
jgi:predicted enzyme related to lactoylglutathione lyase